MITATSTKERPILFRGDLVRKMWEDGMTHEEIAAEVGCSKHPIGQFLRSLGLRRPAKRRPGKGVGSNNSMWKGGRSPRKDGYIRVRVDMRERLEHDVVMETHLGRPLKPGEIVHHKDRNKQNNAIENLELTTQAAHIREHLPEMHKARFGK